MYAFKRIRWSALNFVTVLSLVFSVLGLTALPAVASGDGLSTDAGFAGAVYVLTNDATANGVAVFYRAGNGVLTDSGTIFHTGGRGTGANLGSQGALTLSRDGRRLFAVNAGSNDVSSFAVTGGELELVSRVPSGGVQPISITSYGDLVYVLNAGGSGNITGFRVDQNGALSPIANSSRPFSSYAAGAAEVEFSRSGKVLAVTEKSTNKVDIYTMGNDGTASNPMTYASSGAVPFGFDFGLHDTLVVSEAPGSAASSYAVSDDGGLQLISASVPDFQLAACWLVVTGNGRLAFVANAANSTISSYRIAADGALALAYEVAASLPAGSGPLDLGLSRNSQYLYQLAGAANTITGFRVHEDGSLTQVGSPLPVPASAIGIAAQ